jgi:ankyrin repeat protein
VNAKWNGGLTYLHQAAVKRRNGVVELLIGKGLDVNAKDEDGDTPLDWANGNGNRRTADLLRKHGGKTKKELEAAGN